MIFINGKKDDKTIKMLSGAVNYVLSQQKDFNQLCSYFPNYIINNSQKPISKSRLAWCYGDLGISMALLQAGKAIDNPSWIEKGIEVLLQSTLRQKYEDSLVMDAGICHGSVGLAIIYRRIYLETGLKEFIKASNYYLIKSLQMASFEDGLAGYKTFEIDGWKCDYSFITGIAGIGTGLLSFLTEDKQTWDEILLMS